MKHSVTLDVETNFSSPVLQEDFFSCVFGFCFFFRSRSLPLLIYTASFVSNVYRNMFRYVNYARVIYKSRQSVEWLERAGMLNKTEQKWRKKHADTACMINMWQCWHTNCSKNPNKSMVLNNSSFSTGVQKPFSESIYFFCGCARKSIEFLAEKCESKSLVRLKRAYQMWKNHTNVWFGLLHQWKIDVLNFCRYFDLARPIREHSHTRE